MIKKIHKYHKNKTTCVISRKKKEEQDALKKTTRRKIKEQKLAGSFPRCTYAQKRSSGESQSKEDLAAWAQERGCSVRPSATRQGSHLGHLCRQLGWAGSRRGNAVQKLGVAAPTGPLAKPFSLRLPTQEVWG